MDYSALDPLLKELKKVWKATVPPEGRDGCKDCGRRKTLNAIENSIELADSFSPGAPYNRDLRHFFARRYEHCAALARLEDAVDLESPSISMMSAWFA